MAAKLKSMKRSEKDRREDAGYPAPIEAIGPDFPYGLTLNIDKDELDKLGITSLPKVGTVMNVTALAKVTMVNQSAVEGADEETRICLQITDMALEPGGGDA